MQILENHIQISNADSRDLKNIVYVSRNKPQVGAKRLNNVESKVASSLKLRIQQCKQAQVNDLSSVLESDFNLDEVIGKIVSTMNKMASVEFKGSVFIEPCEVNTIKELLVNYEERSAKIAQIKRELETFSTQIQTNYSKRIFEQKKEKVGCEDQIEVLEVERQQLILARLTKFCWPYDSTVKRYDLKIKALKTRAAKCGFQIEQLTGMRPAANAKDILLFQTELKGKFCTDKTQV